MVPAPVTSPRTHTMLSANLKTRLLLEAAQFPCQRRVINLWWVFGSFCLKKQHLAWQKAVVLREKKRENSKKTGASVEHMQAYVFLSGCVKNTVSKFDTKVEILG